MNREQLRTLLWLRWRLTRNQWSRSKGLGPVLAAILGVGAIFLALAGLVGGFLGGFLALGTASSTVVNVVWLAVSAVFLFVWLIGLLSDLQRAELIDLQKLMHLPVALAQTYFVNYLASLLGPSLAFFVPGMLGLALGLSVSRGPLMLLLIPVVLGLTVMITAWTYCFQGYIASWISNPRRRRVVVTVLTLAVVSLGQLPNLYFNVLGKSDRFVTSHNASVREKRAAANREALKALEKAELALPPLWLAASARSLAEGSPVFSILAALGLFGFGALGLDRGYRSTARFQAGAGGGSSGTAAGPEVDSGKPRLVERRFPGVSEQTSAVAAATIRSLLRAPEVAIAWGVSLVLTVIAGIALVVRVAPTLPPAYLPLVIAGALAFSNFMLIQFMANQFGFDRDAFRQMLLAPIDRAQLLLGKNLATMGLCALPGLVVLAVVATVLRPSPLILLAAVFQWAAMNIAALAGGNLISILVPYRVNPGTLKASKMPPLAMVVLLACHMLFPSFTIVPLAGPLLFALGSYFGWSHLGVTNMLVSMVVAVLAAAVYRLSLGPLGRLLQRRETIILARVTLETQ